MDPGKVAVGPGGGGDRFEPEHCDRFGKAALA